MQHTPPSRVLQYLLLLIGLMLGWVSIASERGPVIPKGKGDSCVAETDFMRRNHMDLIVHQRDETVIRGIRDEPFSLVECVDCHVQRDTNDDPIRVDSEGQFCASCHAFVAAKIDCFSCHAAVPDIDSQERVDGNHWLPNKRLIAFLPHVAAPLTSPVESTFFESNLGNDRDELNSDNPE